MTTQQQEQVHEYKVGDIAAFIKYTELKEGETPLLKEGERLIVQQVQDDGGLVVAPVTKGNKPIDSRQADVVFDDEIKLVKGAKKAAKAKKANGKAAVDPEVTEAKKAMKSAAKSKLKVGAKAKAKAAPKAEASKAIAPVAKQEVMPPIKHDKEVQEALAGGDVLKVAKTLVAQAEETYYTLGGVLCQIDQDGLHEKAGKEYQGVKGFHAWVEKELGIEYRKARYLINIYHKFTLAGINRRKLAQIGWSVAKEMARLEVDALKRDFDELAAFAKNNTRDDLAAHVRKNYEVATRGGEKVKVTRMNFKLIGDAANTVERALKEAGEAIDGNDPNAALEHVCGEWLNLASGVDAAGGEQVDTLDELIALAESKFGATVTQIDTQVDVEGK